MAVWDLHRKPVEGSAGQTLLIMELGTHARIKHLKIVEWWVARVNAVAGERQKED